MECIVKKYVLLSMKVVINKSITKKKVFYYSNGTQYSPAGLNKKKVFYFFIY